jgi:hypothetical protein
LLKVAPGVSCGIVSSEEVAEQQVPPGCIAGGLANVHIAGPLIDRRGKDQLGPVSAGRDLHAVPRLRANLEADPLEQSNDQVLIEVVDSNL